MAKGIDINGTLRGKRGGIVYYRREGQQNSRVRVAPRNPKSAKQSVQRMVLATAAKMAAAFEPIVNHSFEGVQVGPKSLQFFRAEAMKLLRNVAGAAISGNNALVADFAIKGSPCVGCINHLLISRGSLAMNNVVACSDAEFVIRASDAASTSPISTQSAYVAELAKFGLVPGDQLTAIMLLENSEQKVATVFNAEGEETAYNYAQEVRYARVTFKATIPGGFSGQLIADGRFNPALVESSEGVFPAVAWTTGADARNIIQFTPDTSLSTLGAAVIRSQKKENGSFAYSTATLFTSADTIDYNNAPEVYPSYMDAQVSIEVGTNLYLRNAVAAPLA